MIPTLLAWLYVSLWLLAPLLCMPPLFRGGRVLLWNSIGIFTSMKANYEAMGLTVDDGGPSGGGSYTGNINDYGLVFFFTATSPAPGDPPWWSAITGGTWNGRLVICAEGNGLLGTGPAIYVNGLSGTTGIGCTADTLDGSTTAGTAESDPLTSGVSNIYYNFTSQVSGGTTLSNTVTGPHPWLAHNTVGTIDFVVSGDTTWLSDTIWPNNQTFTENLWNVSV